MLTGADLFCGAGGFTAGTLYAAARLGLSIGDFLAVNHWPVAMATHSLNHPGVRHLCNDIADILPQEAVPGGRLDLLLASPECTHFSNARGGKPVSDQRRSSANNVVAWCRALDVQEVIVENVPEFRTWGPLGADDKPTAAGRGRYYRRFLTQLANLGYGVEERIFCAADYGDATTRKRLFIRASKTGSVRWPEPSHAKGAKKNCKPWRPAREIIDWSLEGESVFTRKRPLSPNTMRRILAGLAKFSGLPFVSKIAYTQGDARVSGIDEPMPTICANYEHYGLARPYLVVLRQHCDAQDLGEPAPTVCANGQHLGLAQPFLVNMKGKSDAASIDAPAPTITAGAPHLYLAEPELRLAPFLVKYHGDHGGADESDRRVFSVDEPLRTVDGSNRYGLAEPESFLVRYNRTSDASSVQEPVPTLTTKDRLALACPEVIGEEGAALVVDIKFRMLTPRELARAQGFPDEYVICGTRENQVKQIGNAVPFWTAAALAGAALSDRRVAS
jgi:DNA (cytosine-5)-methyltransferase 1